MARDKVMCDLCGTATTEYFCKECAHRIEAGSEKLKQLVVSALALVGILYLFGII